MNTESFRINLLTFWEATRFNPPGFKMSDEVKNEIYRFLEARRLTKPIEVMYKEFALRNANDRGSTIASLIDKLPHKTLWETSFLDAPTLREMRRQLCVFPDIEVNPDGYPGENRINSYYFPLFNGSDAWFGNGAIINLPIDLKFENANDQPLFRTLFIEIFTQTKWPDQFLHYHFKESFNRSNVNFRLFLKSCLSELKVRKPFLKQWIKDNLSHEVSVAPLALDFGQEINYSDFTKTQVAMEYYYRIEHGSHPGFRPKEKTKFFKQLAVAVNKAWKPLQTQYTDVAKPGKAGEDNRRLVLSLNDNVVNIERLLKPYSDSLLAFKKDLAKLRNPLT